MSCFLYREKKVFGKATWSSAKTHQDSGTTAELMLGGKWVYNFQFVTLSVVLSFAHNDFSLTRHGMSLLRHICKKQISAGLRFSRT